MKNYRNEALNDEIIKKAVEIYTIQWLEKIESKCNTKAPLSLDNKVIRLIKTHNKTKSHKRKNTLRLTIIIAILAILISSLSVSAVRETLKNFFMDFFSTHNVISYNIDKQKYPKTIDNVYMLDNVPPEFELIDNTITDTSVFTLYLSEDKQILFEQYTKDSYIEYIDNENSVSNCEIINNIEYYITYIEISSEYKIIWEKDGYIFSLIGGLSKDELIKLCEKIK